MSKNVNHSNSPPVLLMSLAALGVVYGDIGTSPIYAIREMFFGHGASTFSQLDILSEISLVIWSLTLIVAVKYIIFVLRADNEGGGGVFALYGLLHHVRTKTYEIVGVLLMFAAGLLFGDGVITPAISVLSAVEGLSVLSSTLSHYVIPITVLILVGLFMLQSYGTAKIGTFFGPIMLIWFCAISLISIPYIVSNPVIFKALNPVYAISFFVNHDLISIFKTLGAVMLVVTGGEALYADLGHFGKNPIRLSWFGVAFPALIINYFGQGAFLLSGKTIVGGNLFFSLVPGAFIIPMVILSTMATVIASQALISGVFSLVMQAVSLGLLPYQKYSQTHEAHEGQIYVPLANWLLLAGSIIFVLVFKTSNNLASAYGLAVSGVMFVTTLGMILVARKYWNWSKILSLLVFIPFLLIDGTFLISNSIKFLDGGFIPVVIAAIFALIFSTWMWGKRQIRDAFKKYPVTTISDVIKAKEERGSIPKTVVLLTSVSAERREDPNPIIEQVFMDRYGELPDNIILLKINRLKHPFAKNRRYKVVKIYQNPEHGSITGVEVNFGFMEEPNVEKVLRGIAKHKEVPISENNKDWLIHILQPMVHINNDASLLAKLRYSLFNLLNKISDTPVDYFHLGDDEPLSVDYVSVHLG